MSSLDIVPREESERRLAAILVADVVGYSRLMQADEEGTLSRLEEIGASIIEPRVAAHRGHIVPEEIAECGRDDLIVGENSDQPDRPMD